MSRPNITFMLENLQSSMKLIKVCQDQFQTMGRKLCKIKYLAKYVMMNVPTLTKTLGHQASGLFKFITVLREIIWHF